MASVQDWDVLWRFAYAHQKDWLFKPSRMDYFDNSRDPLNMAADRITTLMFLRGDVKPFDKRIAVDLAEDTLRNRLREIIPDAEVKLSLANKTFTIIGDINSGTFTVYKDKLTIFQALAMSGDLANPGDRQHVRIIRPHGNDEPEVLEFDIRTNTVIDSKYYYVYPNDVIYVSRAPGSFYKVSSYSGFLGLITSSLALLIAVLNYTTLF